MKIGIAIRTVRTHFEISQAELSISTGLSQTSISQIENGLKEPTKKTIEKICKAVQIPEAVLYILGIDNSDIPPERKKMFNALYPQIKNLAIEILGKKINRRISIINKPQVNKLI